MSKAYRHDGSELELLLSGSKPLAAFSYYVGASEIDCLHQQDFATAVEDGRILRFEMRVEFDGAEIVFVAFTVPEESWRAQAYFHLKRFLIERDWCPHLEWIEGSLLGYTDVQNRSHLLEKYSAQELERDCKC